MARERLLAPRVGVGRRLAVGQGGLVRGRRGAGWAEAESKLAVGASWATARREEWRAGPRLAGPKGGGGSAGHAWARFGFSISYFYFSKLIKAPILYMCVANLYTS